MTMLKILKSPLQLIFLVSGLLIAFPHSVQGMQLSLNLLGTYQTGIFDSSAAEIPAYDPMTNRLFVTSSATNTINILDISNPTTPTLFGTINLTGGGVNSVAVKNGIVAVAEQAAVVTDTGTVSFYGTSGTALDIDGMGGNTVTVGALPDMLTFTPDGSKILVANEGEPNEAYTVDPEGSISIINVSDFTVQTADFGRFNSQIDNLRNAGVRIFGLNATVAQDVEPEYITATNDKAYVSLQENNALAIVDIATATVEDILALDFKEHSLPQNALDPSDRDGGININSYQNLLGMYQPDTIALYRVNGQTYIVTANEGDARIRPTDDDILPSPNDQEGAIFNEESRIKDLTLDPTAFPDSTIQDDDQLGRLAVTNTLGDIDNDGDFDQLYAFGGRSFSIWDTDGNLIYDSGDDFETRLASLFPQFFNSDNDEPTFDTRSDAKGPEPEALTIGVVGSQIYAFIGLERMGGIMVYNITDPLSPFFVTYTNNRDFTLDPTLPNGESNPLAGDSGPEGMLFIDPSESPTGSHLLVVANEVSGTTSIYGITQVPESSSVLGLAIAGLMGGLTQIVQRKKDS
jgi:hypothetical protein